MSKSDSGTAFQPWTPTKPAEKYSNEEIQSLDAYKMTKQLYPHLREEQRLSLTRDAIRMQWTEVRASALDSEVRSLFDVARERGLIKDGIVRLTISLEETDDGKVRGTYAIPPKKKGRRKRFQHADYANLIGREFVKDVTNSRKNNEERNGQYLLKIEGPFEQDDASDYWKDKFADVPFSATLVQKPSNGDKLPKIQFPPDPTRESEDDRANDDDLIEVVNMTQMMGVSRLKHPQSPAVYFKLDELESDDDSNEDTSKESESRVHEALDDDDE